jgi:hypothetical protein
MLAYGLGETDREEGKEEEKLGSVLFELVEVLLGTKTLTGLVTELLREVVEDSCGCSLCVVVESWSEWE